MPDLERIAYNALDLALTEILRSSGALVAGTEIRNLNIGLCLVQCKLTQHPLVQSMALGKKLHVAYWMNDAQLGQMLEGWLVTDVLLAMLDAEDICPAAEEEKTKARLDAAQAVAFEACARAQRDVSDAIKRDEERPFSRVHGYTFIMCGYLVRNLRKLRPSVITLQQAYCDAIGLICGLAAEHLNRGDPMFLDFCLPLIAELPSEGNDKLAALQKALVAEVRSWPEQDNFWSRADHDYVAHVLMDLSLAGHLPERLLEKSVEKLAERIHTVCRVTPINIQSLTRLSRSLGQIACERFEHLPAKLWRCVTPTYAQNILDEIERQVLDRRGFEQDGIKEALSAVEVEDGYLTDGLADEIYRVPYKNGRFRARPKAEYADLVRAPEGTLKNGGDCDCVAAMYAALLLAAGLKEVHVWHLCRRADEESAAPDSLHAVTSVQKPDDSGDYFCFDPPPDDDPGSLPTLRVVSADERSVNIFRSSGDGANWVVSGHRILRAPVQVITAESVILSRPTQGVAINPSKWEPPEYRVCWLMIDIEGGSSETMSGLRELCDIIIDQQRAAVCDWDAVIVANSQSIYGPIKNRFELWEMDGPLLVIFYAERDESGKLHIFDRVLIGPHRLDAMLKQRGARGVYEMLCQYANAFGGIQTRKLETFKRWSLICENASTVLGYVPIVREAAATVRDVAAAFGRIWPGTP